MLATEETLKIIADAKAKHGDAITVAYSGGKDSLAVMDLCSRSFSRVEAFFMYLVPGLECVDQQLDFARQRWGVKVRQFPHWILGRIIRSGVYCANYWTYDDVPDLKLADIYELAVRDIGIPLIATGAKYADGPWRRRNMAMAKKGVYEHVIYPLMGWTKHQVIGYLNSQKIPLPAMNGVLSTGIDLSVTSLLWLHDTFPEDFKRICEVFPYAEAVVWRREWYGIDA